MTEWKYDYTAEFLTWLEDNYDQFREGNLTYYVGKISGKMNNRTELLDHWFMLTNHR